MVKNTMPPPSDWGWKALPTYQVVEDHWEYPNHKRVDVRPSVEQWIQEQDITQWKYDVDVPGYTRFIITPELLTVLTLKFR